MKLIRNIILPALFIAGLSLETLALPGDPPVTLVPVHKTDRDTADPSLAIVPDTTDPVAMKIVAVLDSGDTDPLKPKIVISADSAEEDEETFASEFYNDFDTTAVHCEKFDVLNFNDSVLIVLSDSMHGNYVNTFNCRPT